MYRVFVFRLFVCFVFIFHFDSGSTSNCQHRGASGPCATPFAWLNEALDGLRISLKLELISNLTLPELVFHCPCLCLIIVFPGEEVHRATRGIRLLNLPTTHCRHQIVVTSSLRARLFVDDSLICECNRDLLNEMSWVSCMNWMRYTTCVCMCVCCWLDELDELDTMFVLFIG